MKPACNLSQGEKTDCWGMEEIPGGSGNDNRIIANGSHGNVVRAGRPD